MIQKSYSKFFVERPSFILHTAETTSPNASQTAIDHHPLTLCLCISENSTTTTISIEGPDPVDAKIFEDPIRCFVFTQLSSGTAIFQYLSEGDPGTHETWIIKHAFQVKFHQCFRKLHFPWKKKKKHLTPYLGGRTSQQPAWPVVVSQQLQLLATLGLSHPWPRCLTTCDLL